MVSSRSASLPPAFTTRSCQSVVIQWIHGLSSRRPSTIWTSNWPVCPQGTLPSRERERSLMSRVGRSATTRRRGQVTEYFSWPMKSVMRWFTLIHPAAARAISTRPDRPRWRRWDCNASKTTAPVSAESCKQTYLPASSCCRGQWLSSFTWTMTLVQLESRISPGYRSGSCGSSSSTLSCSHHHHHQPSRPPHHPVSARTHLKRERWPTAGVLFFSRPVLARARRWP